MTEFSIIVPVYNVEKYLQRCVDSVLAQTYQDFELILVNDGSSDDSGNICDEYSEKDGRIRVVHKENGGVSTARNAGLDAAQGKYIVFIDSDDEVEPDYLACMREYDADLVIAGVQNYSADGKPVQQLKYAQEEIAQLATERLCRICDQKAVNYVYSKRFDGKRIRDFQIRFHERMNLAEDTLFVAEYLCRCQSVQFVSALPYIYYTYGESTLSGFCAEYIQKLIAANGLIARTLESSFPGIAVSDAWKRRCWSVFYYGIFYILREWKASAWIKYRTLKACFAMPEFKEYCRSLDYYMQKDSKLMRILLRTRNVFIVMAGWKVIQLKSSLERQKR